MSVIRDIRIERHGGPLDHPGPLAITESYPPMPSADAPAVRAVWWRLRRHGVRLPAERDVIVVDRRVPPSTTEKGKGT